MDLSLRYRFLFFFALLVKCSYSQFTGGAYDGFASAKTSCPAAANVFTGGSYDGFAVNNSTCPAPSNVFTGGSYDGFAVNNIACPAASNVYVGGSYDGFAVNNIACPAASNIFTGGSYAGFSVNGIACAVSNIFTGGSYEGFAVNSLACPIISSIFSGGSYDGFAVGGMGCPSVFTGGSYSGFSVNSVACPPTAAIFAGGSYDGFSLASVACAAFSNVFTGGSYDGFSVSSIACALSNNVFMGGSFDGFAIGVVSPCNPLPIELLYFDAECIYGKVNLSWATASESNNDYFTIGRTPDGVKFENIGVVKGAGNSNQRVLYSFTDPDPLDGIFYYRLKQTDYNGQYEYFDLATAICSEADGGISVYPNPNNGHFIVQCPDVNSYLILNDPLGNRIFEQKISSLKTEINLENLSNGIYFVQVISQQGNAIRKISINK